MRTCSCLTPLLLTPPRDKQKQKRVATNFEYVSNLSSKFQHRTAVTSAACLDSHSRTQALRPICPFVSSLARPLLRSLCRFHCALQLAALRSQLSLSFFSSALSSFLVGLLAEYSAESLFFFLLRYCRHEIRIGNEERRLGLLLLSH